MKSLVHAIVLNIALMCLTCMNYMIFWPVIFLIQEKLALKLDRAIMIVLVFQLSWIFALCVDLFFFWVTK